MCGGDHDILCRLCFKRSPAQDSSTCIRDILASFLYSGRNKRQFLFIYSQSWVIELSCILSLMKYSTAWLLTRAFRPPNTVTLSMKPVSVMHITHYEHITHHNQYGHTFNALYAVIVRVNSNLACNYYYTAL